MKSLELVLWFKCNCRCAFCAVDEELASSYMKTADALAALERGRERGARRVDFGGGEPTLRDDLPELARRAKRLGYRSVGVKSNGMRLCYSDYVDELLEAGVSRFAVPVWGPSAAAHDALARRPGAFDLLEMGIKNVLDLGGELELDVLLTSETTPELSALAGYFERLGVRRFAMWLYCLFGADGARPELLPSLVDAGAAIGRAADELTGAGAAVSTTHVPFCFLPERHRGCYERIAARGLVIETPGGSFPAESSPFEAGVQTARCEGCAERARCGGVRPEYLERFSDRELRPIA